VNRVATRLAPAFDLLAAYEPGGVVFERQGVGVGGGAAGSAVDLADVATVLDRTPERSVAIGALPFGGGGTLLVPDRLVRRTEPGETWLVGEHGTFARVAGGTPHPAFGDPQRHPHPDAPTYAAAVDEAVRRIGTTELRKVVLARTLEVGAGRSLDAARLAHRLRAVDPDAFTFVAPAPGGTIVGASPELLVERRGSIVRANPLAGTAPRAGDLGRDHANAEALLASSKDREEHAIVVDAIAEVLGPRCERLTYGAEPALRGTPNVWHLSTMFEGTLRDPAPSALELALELHPTPAVAGAPTGTALGAIVELEPFDRGAYAGPVGWVDARGDGTFAIALRCALLDGDRATLFAGAGIVAGSVATSELDETERKFRAFLDALRWG
jgi:isochorismate synthase